MGHEMHILEGFILDSNQYGESGRILKILTKDFGIMSIVATGVREIKSKMRGSMDILQLVNFEFVEGKEVNRLTGIHEKEKFEKIFTGINAIEKRRVVSNVVNFVLRIVVGETQNEKLWESFLEGVYFLQGEGAAEGRPLHIVEIIWLIKLLVSLGYWEEGSLDNFSDSNFEFLKNQDNKKEIVEKINSTIRSTHL